MPARWLLIFGLLCAAPVCAQRGGDVPEESRVEGGLVVVLGCGNVELLSRFRPDGRYIVHGLDRDPAAVARARRSIRSEGLYGPISVATLRGSRLPYADNLVNLLVMADRAPAVDRQEITRVLAPGGRAVSLGGTEPAAGGLVKPWPAEIDEWTHYLHEASGNAVAQDTRVGPPGRVQWMSCPLWTRAHEKMSSFTAMVSAGGRVFMILDEAPVASMAMPADWQLIARDAFNGKLLWKKPISEWWPTMFGFKSGPVFLTRRLVAVGERVYVTLGSRARLSILDAATGEELRTCEGTANTEEIIVHGGTVFITGHEPERTAEKLPTWINKEKRPAVFSLWHPERRWIKALDVESGDILWEQSGMVTPQSLAADARRVYYHDGERVVALDRLDGARVWRSDPDPLTKTPRSDFRPNLVIQDDVVVFSGGPEELPRYDGGYNEMIAFNAETGEQLWKAPHLNSGYESPKDLFIIGGRVWSGATCHNRPMPKVSPTAGTGTFVGYDLRTGDSVSFEPDVPRQWFHHRCYPAKATTRYFITSRQGIEFVDVANQHWDVNHWVRGACLYGVMPANGLLYAPPHPCGCRPLAKLNGFWALGPERSADTRNEDPRVERHYEREKGPAFGDVEPAAPRPSWPTYRRDNERSGYIETAVPASVSQTWRADLGGKLSAPTVAGGKVFVAQVDAHTVNALDADTGQVVWRFPAGGRVDTPPTLSGGLALFGCADGWVYALRASDGALAWRRRVAPEDRLVMVRDQLESAWPLHGSVLVRDGVAWCLAGRSMFLDGGMRLVALDAGTGELLSDTLLEAEDLGARLQDVGRDVDLSREGARADILVADGENLYVKHLPFDFNGQLSLLHRDAPVRTDWRKGLQVGRPHLFAPQGFLDETWHHRSYTVYGNWFGHGSGGFYLAAGSQPSGRLLVFDRDRVYGFGKRPPYFGWTTPIEYRLFSTDRTPEVKDIDVKGGYSLKTTFVTHWRQRIPMHVRAMAKAADTVFIAGPPDVFDEGPRKTYGDISITPEKSRQVLAAWKGKLGASLWAVAAADGEKLSELKLAVPPVWDGMATADGRLYLACTDGSILCFAR